MGRLEGRIAIVTGGGGGIGSATCRVLAREGATVIVADVAAENAESVAAGIVKAGGRAQSWQVDVADFGSVRTMVDHAVERFGAIDILHNNAAAINRDREDIGIAEMELESWDAILAVNLSGVMHGCRAALPHMRRQGRGAIINTSSGAARQSQMDRGAYDATKGGVEALTRHIAVSQGKHGIRCNVVAPGLVLTENVMRIIPQEIRDECLAHVPTPYLGATEDIAHAVLFLASDEARYVNGATLDVDGGLSKAVPFTAIVRRFMAMEEIPSDR
jgi:NAD(P)-dependent dehydrogenase (short-subunit alcohol dehydrogenase family)